MLLKVLQLLTHLIFTALLLHLRMLLAPTQKTTNSILSSFSYTGINNVTLGGGYFFDNQGNNEDEVDVLNLHASTSFGKLFLAAEYTELNRGANVNDGSDLDGYMVLADYDINNTWCCSSRKQQRKGRWQRLRESNYRS